MNALMMHDEQDASLHLMSFNVRRPMSERSWNRSDRWSSRQHRMRELLQTERPEVLAAQEVLPRQARFVRSSLGPAYRWIGWGREWNGSGEGCPVFYDAERLALLQWRQLALSNTPGTAGSRSWGNLFPRVVVNALFFDRRTAAVFRLLNTHLDPFSRRSRLRSAAAIGSLVSASSEPVVVAGDFNSGPGSAADELLLEEGLLIDAWHAAHDRLTPEYATLASYRRPRRGRRIDWILTTPDIYIDRIAINAAQFDGGWPSDHLPVQAEIVFPATAGHA